MEPNSRIGPADQVRVRGLHPGHRVRGGQAHQPRAGKLRPVLHLHLQRRRQHNLVHQLHPAHHSPGPQETVSAKIFWMGLKIFTGNKTRKRQGTDPSEE